MMEDNDDSLPEGLWTTTAPIHPGVMTQIILSGRVGSARDASHSEDAMSVRDLTFSRDVPSIQVTVVL